ncbi:hypothetical protein 000TH008_130 [Bacillus phage 000TH008]|nr:hypothetical protein 000TH008_130 [Bacillus phage 000TH008]QQO40824.1 hypothetical protein 000TH009_130 [Bacillus phage 000TH009]
MTVYLTEKQAEAFENFMDLQDGKDQALQEVYNYHGDYEDWDVEGSYYLNELPRENLAYIIITGDYEVIEKRIKRETVYKLLDHIYMLTHHTDTQANELEQEIKKATEGSQKDSGVSYYIIMSKTNLLMKLKGRAEALKEVEKLIEDILEPL